MQSIRRLAFVVGLLASSLLAAAQESTGGLPAPWLPAGDLQLFERSFARCLKASYRAIGVEPSDERIRRALSNDLDQFSGSLTLDDVRRAPTERVGGVLFIRCSWYSEHAVVR